MLLDLKPAHLAAGMLMAWVGLIAASMAKWVWRIEWRWLGCGALLWAIAALEKFGLDCSINGPALKVLRDQLPTSLYLTLGSSYIGLQTGYTEVLTTLVAGLIWRQLAYNARRAVGIGIGAGAFEALYWGFKIAVDPTGTHQIGIETSISATALLVPAVERMIVIPCHTASRAAALFAVATGHWSWFWAGFVFFSAIDGLCGFYMLTNMTNTINPWLIELSFAVFALISIPILQYVWRRWPANAMGSTANSRVQRDISSAG